MNVDRGEQETVLYMHKIDAQVPFHRKEIN